MKRIDRLSRNYKTPLDPFRTDRRNYISQLLWDYFFANLPISLSFSFSRCFILLIRSSPFCTFSLWPINTRLFSLHLPRAGTSSLPVCSLHQRSVRCNQPRVRCWWTRSRAHPLSIYINLASSRTYIHVDARIEGSLGDIFPNSLRPSSLTSVNFAFPQPTLLSVSFLSIRA